MLSVIAYVWKKYTGELLHIFKRDGGKKPVSVEMIVYETKNRPDGSIELLDFKYEGVTILGSFVTPSNSNGWSKHFIFFRNGNGISSRPYERVSQYNHS